MWTVQNHAKQKRNDRYRGQSPKKCAESFENLQCKDQIYKKKHKTIFKLR